MKFFAQYYYQKVWKLNGVRMLVDSWIEEGSMIEKSWLELLPLSSITDEDCIEIAKLMWEDEDLHMVAEGLYLSESLDKNENEIDMYPKNALKMSDYLRSKGYALPWMGLSVEKLQEYGWIKLRQQYPNYTK